jgi:DNA-binding CsgD family transcriptional regulator
MDGRTPGLAVAQVAAALDYYAVPAFVTDELNRVRITNREFQRRVGDPQRDGVPADQRFIAALMLGPYRDRFPRREEELEACLPGIPDEVDRGNLSPRVQVLLEQALRGHTALRRRFIEGTPNWDGTVLIRDGYGADALFREVVIPLADSNGWHLNQWIPADEAPAGEGIWSRLTPRQSEIARLYACGLTAREVAERAGISHRTARDHLEAIYSRLEVHSRAALATIVVRDSLE